jgi:hypothetical protein
MMKRVERGAWKLPEGVKRGEEIVYEPEEVKKEWAQAYEKLGKEDPQWNKTFDDEWRKEVEKDENDPGEAGLELPIQQKEVEEVISRMKNGKAGGTDGIVNEMIKNGGEQLAKSITWLFNLVWDWECIPEDWKRGVIFPIFKGGDNTDPNDYRGITLLSVLGKSLEAVLNKRLYTWCEENGILIDQQGGFRAERGCPEMVWTLDETIKWRKRRRMTTYMCFLDVRKAYDTVWFLGLWHRMKEKGIGGKLLRVCKEWYDEMESCVLVRGDRTNWFPIEQGVKQGGILSPLLYSLFINDIALAMEEAGCEGVEVGSQRISILMYADDVSVTNKSPQINP